MGSCFTFLIFFILDDGSYPALTWFLKVHFTGPWYHQLSFTTATIWGSQVSILQISRSSQCSITGVTKAVVCAMVHIKEPLLLIGKSSLCGGSGFPFSLSEWSLTICLTPYNRK